MFKINRQRGAPGFGRAKNRVFSPPGRRRLAPQPYSITSPLEEYSSQTQTQALPCFPKKIRQPDTSLSTWQATRLVLDVCRTKPPSRY